MLRLIDQSRSKALNKQNQWLEELPIDAIRPNPYQPRHTFHEDSIEELSRSITQFGLINPISVRKIGNAYELVAGERRLRASKKAGFTTIKAIIINAYEQDSALIAMIENLQRENLHFLEEAEGYMSLLKNHNMTQEELARKLGKNQSTIANRLRLLRLSAAIKEAIVSCRLTERHARALLRIPDEAIQMKLITIIRNMKLSVASTESLVQKTLDKMYGCEPEEKSSPRITRIIRDSRLLVNSMKKAVDSMCQSGMDAAFTMEEVGEQLEVKISLPWRHKNAAL
ncbi:MAG: ParB/RepB/Spo0J family partition protein [Christensenellales bacterium]|jgi:ParB family chromosome partitioning protein